MNPQLNILCCKICKCCLRYLRGALDASLSHQIAQTSFHILSKRIMEVNESSCPAWVQSFDHGENHNNHKPNLSSWNESLFDVISNYVYNFNNCTNLYHNLSIESSLFCDELHWCDGSKWMFLLSCKDIQDNGIIHSFWLKLCHLL